MADPGADGWQRHVEKRGCRGQAYRGWTWPAVVSLRHTPDRRVQGPVGCAPLSQGQQVGKILYYEHFLFVLYGHW
ncbi:hypothetical protein GCM10009556_092520 [Acrocarpospora pleiomorpha]